MTHVTHVFAPLPDNMENGQEYKLTEWFPRCCCGWTGSRWHSERDAQDEALLHLQGVRYE